MKKCCLPALAVALLLAGCAHSPNTPPLPPVPAHPLRATLAAIPGYSLTLAWDYGTNDMTLAFRVYSSLIAGVYTNTGISSGTNHGLTMSNLLKGVTNYFVVAAVDTNGVDSLFSNEIGYMVPLPLPKTNVVISIATLSAAAPTGPWTYFTNAPILTVTNPTQPSAFWRLSITSTNF